MICAIFWTAVFATALMIGIGSLCRDTTHSAIRLREKRATLPKPANDNARRTRWDQKRKKPGYLSAVG